MKIALVSEHASPLADVGDADAGGQNVHVASLARALADRGHAVIVYTRRDSEEVDTRVDMAPGVTVEHIGAGPASPLSKDELLPHMAAFGFALSERWRADPPDVAHAHFWMSGVVALMARRELRIPLVQTFHALGVVKRRHLGEKDTSPPARIRLEAAIARDADCIVATSSEEVFELIRMGVPRQSIHVIPCGVDVTHFQPEGPAFPARTEENRLLCVGRLVERKGIDDAIRALRLVPKTELLIAGGPDARNLGADPEAQRLVRVAEKAGVDDRVIMLGRVPRENMPALYRSADLVVCVPWYEPFGMVPLEAMACSVPVVAAAVGGLTDTVVEHATGILVPPRRYDMLANRLRRLLADPVIREGYGIAAVDRARARYPWERIAKETEAVYEAVYQDLARSRTSRALRTQPRRAAR